jgi:hypothetical protein
MPALSAQTLSDTTAYQAFLFTADLIESILKALALTLGSSVTGGVTVGGTRDSVFSAFLQAIKVDESNKSRMK